MSTERRPDRKAVARARKLRSEMGVGERVMWDELRSQRMGIRFRRQVPFGPYVLDFYCTRAKVCVELDGPHHQLRVGRDRFRDAWLERRGVVTIRVPTAAIFDGLGAEALPLLERIREVCQARLSCP